MSERQREIFTGAQIAKVTLEAIKGIKTVNQMGLKEMARKFTALPIKFVRN